MASQPIGSSERPTSLVERSPALILAVDPARVRGAWNGRAPVEVAIMLDGIVQAVISASTDGFAWDVPPHVFGRLLDVVATGNGASMLQAPLDLSKVRPVRWTQWALGPRGVAGTFEAAGTDAATLPVTFVADGVHHASGFAHRRPDGVIRVRHPR